MRALSKNIGDTENNPASFAWSAAALSVPREIEVVEGRMTGGGSVFKGNMRVTHGFKIHCDLRKPNNIEVNWPGGNNFHMTELTSAVCTDDLGIDQRPPVAHLVKLNGVSGARIEFVFADAGEPGKKDIANIKIWDDVNNLVLEVSGFLRVGNHQAHR